MNIKHVKWLGLLGAASSGAAQIVAGDFISGAGVIAAALSTAGVFATQ